MIFFRRLTLFLLLLCLLNACKDKSKADLIFYNGVIYTADSNFTVVDAMAVKDGKIIATGSQKEILKIFESDQIINLEGKSVLPGLNDSHTHFYGYCKGLEEINLVGTSSFDAVIDSVKKYANKFKGKWIKGRGWDQNDWKVKDFPDASVLDSLFPEQPVYLARIDGHAALVNSAALKMAKISADTLIEGGKIGFVRLKGQNHFTGLLVDNAAELVKAAIPPLTYSEMKELLIQGQKNCLSSGLTSLSEAGLKDADLQYLQRFSREGLLQLKMNIMLEPEKETLDKWLKSGPRKNDSLNVLSFKIYADGALGSRGACLKKPYSDSKSEKGFLLSHPDSLSRLMKRVSEAGFQICTHAIGDSANKLILDLYSNLLSENNDKRWRIEHAQVVSLQDREMFKKYRILPSMQPGHATSDMYWAEKRLGEKRLRDAYNLKSLLNQNKKICLGSDFPVESYNPFYGMYASVSRMDQKKIPAGGFRKEEGLNRIETLMGYTVWASWAEFNELKKGSLEKGKSADFIVIDRDYMHCSEYELWQIKVISSYINGKKVYAR